MKSNGKFVSPVSREDSVLIQLFQLLLLSAFCIMGFFLFHSAAVIGAYVLDLCLFT